jgi:PucR C-terminal helix-turn-helix domain/GGDEF-like domain
VSDLFAQLRNRIDRNARRAVDVYADELPEYGTLAMNSATRADMLDFAVLLRRREAELAADERPFDEGDLAVLRAFGEKRGAAGVSLPAQQRVLVLHSVLTLEEIQEAAGPHDSMPLLRMLGWLPANGLAAQQAYTDGFLIGQKRFLPAVRRVQNLARMLLAGNSAADNAAASLGMAATGRYVVTVVRIAEPPFVEAEDLRDEILEVILRTHRVPMTWHDPGEFVALLPTGELDERAQDEALQLVRDFAQLSGRPCAPGAAIGSVPLLSDALTLARRISEVAPMRAVPSQLNTMADMFAELGVKHMPEVEAWLGELARRLTSGPDLVRTLDAFYRHGMNRLHTAGALRIHPRTLDYRLRRVRELLDIDPNSAQGLRTLSTTINLILAGNWPQ